MNGTSVLLEIGICVMTYLTVLAIEFAPVVFEGLKWQKLAHFIHRFIMPFVILGVVLSTLHQSSLGSLLLIQPAKLYPLWWTPILPILFFISAISIGLSMIILESSSVRVTSTVVWKSTCWKNWQKPFPLFWGSTW